MTLRHFPLRVIVPVLIAMAAVGASHAESLEPRVLIVQVAQGELAWADSRIAEKFDEEFSRRDWLRVIKPASLSAMPAFPADSYDLDSLRDWGLEVGGRFLLFVDVHNERLECRQTLGLPLVLHRYETMGVVEGELRLIDLRSGVLAAAEPFRLVEKATRVYQTSIDDDIADPDLKLSAPAKLRLFDRLETRLVNTIVRRVEPLLQEDN